jgi:membrane associated rhomboid family serine protease
MILPISHEDLRSRRWPLVTLLVIVLCFAVHAFFFVTGGVERGLDRMNATGQHALRYFGEHPYLTPPPELAGLLSNGLSPGQKAALGDLRAAGPPPGADIAAEQAELERRYAAFVSATHEARLFRYGFVPARRNWTALLTSMFVHGGWLHLLGNLWMLWLCGCNLEDRWGRAVFAAVYLLAGAGATLLHLAFFPNSTAPLIGASGAIAGAMGGFFVVFLRTRIRFAYFFLILLRPVFGTFAAPAYVMLPLWLGWEVLSGMWLTGSSVAHWAHVGGFVVGGAAALGLRVTGLETKLDAAVESTVTVDQDPRILTAIEHMDRGRPRDAVPVLQALLREEPGNIDALLSLLRAATELGDDALQADTTARLVERYWALGQTETAIALFEEPRPPSVEDLIPRALVLRVARHHAASRAQLASMGPQAAPDPGAPRAPVKAAALCARLRRHGLTDDVAVRAAVLEASVRQTTGDLDLARSLLTEARESPFCTLEIDRMIEAQSTRLAAEERVRSLGIPT